jgi:hypothetical protein
LVCLVFLVYSVCLVYWSNQIDRTDETDRVFPQPATAYLFSGFATIVVSPRSWGASSVGIAWKWREADKGAAHDKAHRFTIASFYFVFPPVAFPLMRPPERPQGMSLLRRSLFLVCPLLMLPLSLMLLAGLAGCGPAPSDNAPTLDPRASQGEPPLSQNNPPPRTDLIASATSSAKPSPAPLVLENGNGSLPGKGTVSGGDSPPAAPSSSTKPVTPLVVPAWMAKDLASPDVDTRLRSLETWVLNAPVGSIDPLILAFENDEERVRARAMELIEQDWARAADFGE